MAEDIEIEDRPATVVHREPEGIHILEDEKNPPEAPVWTALCGEQCVAWDDGSLDPPSFDFYLLGHGHEKATCKACKLAAASKVF